MRFAGSVAQGRKENHSTSTNADKRPPLGQSASTKSPSDQELGIILAAVFHTVTSPSSIMGDGFLGDFSTKMKMVRRQREAQLCASIPSTR